MSECLAIDPLVTPFIDGELSGAERDRVTRHLQRCAPCHSRVDAERSVRELMRGRQPAFKGQCAPVALRVRCASHCTASATVARAWRRFVPLAVAAAAVLGVGVFVLYQSSTRSTRVMAAELAADHMKCFALDSPRAAESEAAVEAAMAASFGWQVDLPERGANDDLELVGSRLCVYGGGRAAHIMYRRHGEPVSLFMLPQASYEAAQVEALGQQCAIWSAGDRTFVLVARDAHDTVQQLAARLRPTFH